jgi:hypothetical protein
MTRNVYVELDYLNPGKLTRTFSLYPDEDGEGRLMGDLIFKTKVRAWMMADRSTSGFNKITIANADGELDSFADFTFSECRIKSGTPSSNTLLVTAQVERVVLDGERHLEVYLKDATKLLDKPIQDNLFPASETSITGSGTNTYYALENQPRPICFGNTVKSIKPVSAKRSNNEYICHDEDVYTIQTVYDNGVSVTYTHYGEGFTLSTDPAGIITVTLRGQENNANTNRIRYFNEVIDYLLDVRESISYSSSDVSSINSDKGYNYQYYQDNNTNRTIREVIQWLSDSHSGWFYADEDGVIRFGYLDEPAVSQDVEIGQYDVIGNIKVFDDTAPNIKTRVGGNRNWYVLNADDIASSVTQQVRLELSSQWQNVTEGASSLDSFYTDTGEVHDALCSLADAQDEADHVTDLYSQRRKFYQFTSAVDAEIGQTVELTYPRFGLDSGVNLLVLGREIDFINNTYTLTLWG